jgi:hypothetical protein
MIPSRTLAMGTALAFAALPAPLHACEPEPFLFQLPGESVEAAEDRSSRILADNRILRRAGRENDAFKKAVNIYLARKIDTVVDPRTHARITAVQPVHAIRGSAPRGQQRLRDDSVSGMCASVGDGDISDLPPGSYLVVFDGLPHDTFRPRGIDSFSVDSLRNGDLLDALTKLGRDPEQ